MDRVERAEQQRLFRGIHPPVFSDWRFRNYLEYLDYQADRIKEDVREGRKVFIWRRGKLLSGKTYVGGEADKYLANVHGIDMGAVAYKYARDKVAEDLLLEMEVPHIRRRGIDSIPRANKYLPRILIAAQEEHDVNSVEIAVDTGAQIGDTFVGSDGGTTVFKDFARREGPFTPFADRIKLISEEFYGGTRVVAMGILFRLMTLGIPAQDEYIDMFNDLLGRFGKKERVASAEDILRFKRDGAPTYFLAEINEVVHETAEAIRRSQTSRSNARRRNPQFSQALRDQAEIFHHTTSIVAENNPYFEGDEFTEWFNNPKKRDLLRYCDPEIIARGEALMLRELLIFDHVAKAAY